MVHVDSSAIQLPVLVAGNCTVELNLSAPSLPLPDADNTAYPGGLNLGIGGVGYNVAHALHRLGAGVQLLSAAGPDPAGDLLRLSLDRLGLRATLMDLPATPLSLVLTDGGGGGGRGGNGRRQIHRDPKTAADLCAPTDTLSALLPELRVAVLTNVGWVRPLLPLVRSAGVPIVTDLQTTPGPHHPYDGPFLDHADVLFLSGAALTVVPAEAVRAYRQRCDPWCIVVGLGAAGALLSERGQPLHHQPALHPRPVVSTVGAGDALLAAFVRAAFTGQSPQEALRLACLYAGWACGEAGGAAGHLSWSELTRLARPGRVTG